MRGRLLLGVTLLFVVGAFGGCSRQADYPVALMVTDDGLVGTWTVKDNNSNARVEVRQRDVKTARERTVGAANLAEKEDGGATAHAYTLRVTDDDQPQPIELSAILIDLDGVRLLGVQLSDEELDRSPISGLTLPLHYLLRIERNEGSIEVWAPSAALAWVPGAQWLDPPCDPPAEIARDPKRGIRLTSSIDRLIEVYRAEMGKPGFWSDHSMTLNRAP